MWTSPISVPWPNDDVLPSFVPSTFRHAVWLPESTSDVRTPHTVLFTSTDPHPLETPIAITTTAVASLSTYSTMDLIAATFPGTATTTVLTTVFVAPTPPTGGLEAVLPTTTTSVDSEATQSTTQKAKRSTILLGLGVGIAIGILMLAGIAGLYLWRRRRNMHNHTVNGLGDVDIEASEQTGKHNKGFVKFFKLRRRVDDTEWSIESAEKVSIVKNVRAQSVLTRSSSRRSDTSIESGVIPIGIPEQRVALTSHPMTPSYTAIVSESRVKAADSSSLEELPKLDCWPMKE
jgi:hypothetical protein